MSESMRGQSSRLGVVRDHRRRSWIATCPVTEFIIPSICERRAEFPARLSLRRPRHPKRARIHLNGLDAFVLSLIAGLYGSLIYCLAAVVR